MCYKRVCSLLTHDKWELCSGVSCLALPAIRTDQTSREEERRGVTLSVWKLATTYCLSSPPPPPFSHYYCYYDCYYFPCVLRVATSPSFSILAPTPLGLRPQ